MGLFQKMIKVTMLMTTVVRTMMPLMTLATSIGQRARRQSTVVSCRGGRGQGGEQVELAGHHHLLQVHVLSVHLQAALPPHRLPGLAVQGDDLLEGEMGDCCHLGLHFLARKRLRKCWTDTTQRKPPLG